MQHYTGEKLQIVCKAIASIIIEERVKRNKSQRVLADEYDIHKSLIRRLVNAKNDT